MEIETLDQLDVALATGSLRDRRLQNLDLAGREAGVLAVEVEGAIVLGGTTTPALDAHLHSGGALVFPAVTTCPVNPYRSTLYSPDELYAGLDDGYEGTPDSLGYDWIRDATGHHDVFATMLRAVHDDSVGDAFGEALEGRSVVGVMGGHALHRGTDGFATASRLAREVARSGHLVMTGGGPGAMEAANLGARLAGADDDALDDALARLAAVPGFTPDVRAWAQLGLAVAHDHPGGEVPASIGVPTWHYGHEPPNVFADLVAKYFSNAVREDSLLRSCNAGIVYLPGAAGTVQELFQAVTPGYYSPTGGVPLVLVGRAHWTTTLPVWPLLQALGAQRQLANRVFLVDSAAEALALLEEPVSPPRP